MLFKERLRRERKRRRWSQQKLAGELGVASVTVRRWERGRSAPYPIHRLLLKHLLNLREEDFDFGADAGEGTEMVQPPHKNTYFMPMSATPDELLRLKAQGYMFNRAMGGTLPEQPHPDAFRHVLDIGCGAGGWLIEVARRYPSITSLTGVDINAYLIEYCRTQAMVLGVGQRVHFQLVDILHALPQVDQTFDLINLRFGIGYVRLWEWGTLIARLKSVLAPGGVLRLTEAHDLASNSPALNTLWELGRVAAIKAGYALADRTIALTDHLATLMAQEQFTGITTVPYPLVYRGGTSEGEFFADDMQHLFHNALPFYQRFVEVPANYQEILRQLEGEIHQLDFMVTWPIATVWGVK